ncbi:MAG: hypothetical protein ACP5RS_00870 [Thermoplasmata archaeon]
MRLSKISIKITFVILVIAIVLLSNTPSYAYSYHISLAEVCGNVVDNITNVPLRGSLVTIFYDGSVIGKNYTTSNGNFYLILTFQSSQPWNVKVVIENNTYNTFQNTFLLKGGYNNIGTIKLEELPTFVKIHPSIVKTDQNLPFYLNAYAYHTYYNFTTNLTNICNFTWNDGKKYRYGNRVYIEENITGSYYWNVTASYLNASVSSSKPTLVVINPSLVSSINIYPNPVDAYESVLLNLTANYGTPPYKYVLEISNKTISTSSSFYLYRFNNSGVHNITLKVIDSVGDVNITYTKVIVEKDLNVSIIGPSRIDVGYNVMYLANVTGGDGNYFYKWFVNNISSTTNFFNISFGKPGNYNLLLNVSDTSEGEFSTTKTIYVHMKPSINVLVDGETVVNTYTTEQGKLNNFEFIAINGTSPFIWNITPSLSSVNFTRYIGNVIYFNYTYASPGKYNLVLNLTDDMGFTYNDKILVTVVPRLNFDINYNQTWDNGVPYYVRIYIINGLAPYSSTIQINNNYSKKDVSNNNTVTFMFLFNKTGTYYVEISVEDSLSVSITKSFYVTVDNKTALRLFSVYGNTIEVNEDVSVEGEIINGVPPFKCYFYSNGISSPIYMDNFSVSIIWTLTYSIPGDYTIYFYVTDGANVTASVYINVTVVNSLNMSYTFKYNPVQTNVTDQIFIKLNGGIAPYTYLIKIGNENISGVAYTQSIWENFTFFRPGDYIILANITDYTGTILERGFTVKVVPPIKVFLSVPSTVDVNNSFNISININSYGVPYYGYIYVYNSKFLINKNVTYELNFNKIGKYNISFTLVDYAGGRIYFLKNFTIVNKPFVYIIGHSHSYIIERDTNCTFSSLIYNGTSPYNITWVFEGRVYYSYNFTYDFTSIGLYNLSLVVKDFYLNTAYCNITLRVEERLTGLNETIKAETFVSENISCPVLGGSLPYYITWIYNNTEFYGKYFNYTWVVTGIYYIFYIIRDANNYTVFGKINVTVFPFMHYDLLYKNTSVVGINYFVTLVFSGGVAPYNISILVNGKAYTDFYCYNNTSTYINFNKIGTNNVTYIVKDYYNVEIINKWQVFVSNKLSATFIIPTIAFKNISFNITVIPHNGSSPYKIYVNNKLINGTKIIQPFNLSKVCLNIYVNDSMNESIRKIFYINILNITPSVNYTNIVSAGGNISINFLPRLGALSYNATLIANNETFYSNDGNVSVGLHKSGYYNASLFVNIMSSGCTVYEYYHTFLLHVEPFIEDIVFKYLFKNGNKILLSFHDIYDNNITTNVSIQYLNASGPMTLYIVNGTGLLTYTPTKNEGLIKINCYNKTYIITFVSNKKLFNINIIYYIISLIVLIAALYIFMITKKLSINKENNKKIIETLYQYRELEYHQLINIMKLKYKYKPNMVKKMIRDLEKSNEIYIKRERKGLKIVSLKRGDIK